MLHSLWGAVHSTHSQELQHLGKKQQGPPPLTPAAQPGPSSRLCRELCTPGSAGRRCLGDWWHGAHLPEMFLELADKVVN